jgi:Na+-transporting methylmalonyl-CoA/oxaloacetate decarboxylase gamma subunit
VNIDTEALKESALLVVGMAVVFFGLFVLMGSPPL